MQDDINTIFQSTAKSLGSNYFGIADLNPAKEFIEAQGGTFLAEYPVALTAGIDLPDSLANILSEYKDDTGEMLYHHYYDVINRELDRIALHLAISLQKKGYKALPIPASLRTDTIRIYGLFSHKLAAYLAGMGWIGKSCLLVTPEHGPRVRWVTVLTNAPLLPTRKPLESRCGECRECVENCPAQAFTGRIFHKEEPREARFDAAACDRLIASRRVKSGVEVCGNCVWVCPFGKKK